MSSDPQSAAATRGVLAATAAFLFWGLVPLYWKQLQEVAAVELMAYRVVWSLLFLLGLIALRKSFGILRAALKDWRVLMWTALSGVMLGLNWVIYVWAVNSNQVIESSLGYFLAPLGNVALGFLILRERLRLLQWLAIGCAILGVGVLLVGAGHFPWIALTLAGSWSLYAILKKKSPLGPISGLGAETIALFPLAVAFLLWQADHGGLAVSRLDVTTHALVISSAIVTTVPLVLFAYGAQRLRLTTLGLVQYLTPTVQFLIGLYVYEELFDSTRFQACLSIWVGLVIYTADSFWAQRRVLWPVANSNTSR